MNYELIKIVREGNSEVAYLFDKMNGRLVKTFVDDRTRGGGEAHMPPVEVIYDSAPRDFVPSQTSDRVPNSTQPGGGLIPKGIGKGSGLRPNLPDKPSPMKPPPHLAGVFIPEGNPGAAEERRIV